MTGQIDNADGSISEPPAAHGWRSSTQRSGISSRFDTRGVTRSRLFLNDGRESGNRSQRQGGEQRKQYVSDGVGWVNGSVSGCQVRQVITV
jgi:hypothetical protein